MKKLIAFGVVAVVARPLLAQPIALEYRIVRQSGAPGTPNGVTDIDSNNSVVAASGTTLRFELQYRVRDLDLTDSLVPDGLAAAVTAITSNGGTLRRAQLSTFEGQLAGTTPPDPVDQSGLSSRQGLHWPFRGAMANQNNNELGPNGICNVDINPNPDLYTPGSGNTLLRITPLAGQTVHQGNPLYGPSESTGDTTFNLNWYGVYSFEYVVGGASDTIAVNTIPDQGGVTFSYFVDSLPVPTTSTLSATAAYRVVVPAPASVLTLLTATSISCLRRRR